MIKLISVCQTPCCTVKRQEWKYATEIRENEKKRKEKRKRGRQKGFLISETIVS